MNAACCGRGRPPADSERPEQDSRLRRVRKAAGWLVPGALLALLPKCPMCLAAYVALCTGFTMSSASAHILLRALTALGVGTLAWCILRRVLSFLQTKQALNLQLTQTQP